MDSRVTPECLSDLRFSVLEGDSGHLPMGDFGDLHLPALPELPQLPLFQFQRDYVTIQSERHLDAYNKALDTLLKISQLQARMTTGTSRTLQSQEWATTTPVSRGRGVKRAKPKAVFEET